MTVGLYESGRAPWRQAFGPLLKVPVRPVGDDGATRWYLLILPPGSLPKRAATGTLIVSGGDDARHIAATQRVTYGLSNRDAVTISSLRSQHMTVALQRILIGVHGDEIEPQEWLVVKPPNWSLEQTLAYEALALLMRRQPARSRAAF